MSERNGGETILAFMLGGIIGGLIGAAAGVLFAPRAGKDTRKKLAGVVTEVADRAQEIWEEGVEKIQEQKERITSAFEGTKKNFDGKKS